jgi:hypothetical protein
MPLSENWKLLPLEAKSQLLDRLRELPDGTPGEWVLEVIHNAIARELERLAQRD